MKKGFFWSACGIFFMTTYAVGQEPPSRSAVSPGDPLNLPALQVAQKAGQQSAPPTDSIPAERPLLDPDATQTPGTSMTWFAADYLLWWTRSGPVNGPLVTTGSALDPIPGALGQPGTRVVFGNSNLHYNPFSGMRLQGGIGLGNSLALEGGYFLLERRSDQFTAGSDAGGTPVIARPIFNNQTGIEDAERTSSPGGWAGSTNVVSHSVLQGYEFNLAANLRRTETSRFDLLLGFRALNLNEDLVFQDNLTPLVPGVLTFQGAAIAPPSTLSDFDKFQARNNFYGGQIGARWQGQLYGSLSLGLMGKIAFGGTQEMMTIQGNSTLSSPAGSLTVPGGILAAPSNIGGYYRDVFAVAPEGTVNLNWQISPRLSANFGYTFIYLSNVLRPGSQIDRNVNGAQVPTDVDFGNGLGTNRPAFGFHSSDFWAQGLNWGLVYRY